MAEAQISKGAEAAAKGSDQISLTCSTEYSSYPLSEQTCWAVTSFKAPFYEPTARASVDIVAVIDKSGSMRGQKLSLVKDTLHFVIDQLKETDRLSVVTYDTRIYVNFDLMRMTKQHKTQAKTLVDSIRKGSSTNLCGGLIKGMEIIANTKEQDKAQVQSVLLLTDGLANRGIKDMPSILAEVKYFQEPSSLPTRIPPVSEQQHRLSDQAPMEPSPVQQTQNIGAMNVQSQFSEQAPAPPPPPQAPPPSQGTEPASPPSKGTEPTPPPSQGTEPALPPSQGTEPAPLPSQGTEPASPPSQGTEPAPPPSQGTEQAPPPSQVTEPAPLPSQGLEPAIRHSQGTEQALPPSQGTEQSPLPLPPPSQGIEQLPPPPPPPSQGTERPPPPPSQGTEQPPSPPSQGTEQPPPPSQRTEQPPPPLPLPSQRTEQSPTPLSLSLLPTQNEIPLPPARRHIVRPIRSIVLPQRKYNSKFEGTIYTFGFGSDHDATLLEAISTQGGGVYYYIDSNEKIPESFADCLGGLLSVVGQNLSLKVELQGDNSVSEVHANRATNWSTPNKTCDIAMGDLQSEEERDIVLELKLPALPSPQQDLVLKASLSYFNVITSALDTVAFDLLVDRKDGAQGPTNESVDVQRNRIIATKALKEAEAQAEQNRMTDAHAVLRTAISTLNASPSSQQEYTGALASDLHRGIASLSSESTYRRHGKNWFRSKVQTHAMQRSNFVDETDYYQSSSKKALRSHTPRHMFRTPDKPDTV